MGERFTDIAASPVPVLLPFDTAAFLRDRAAGNGSTATGAANAPVGNYLSGFQRGAVLLSRARRLRAVVVARAQDMGELGISYSSPIYVHITGSALLYELDEPAGMIGWPVTGGLEADFPGIARLFLENYVRYTFVRYGVPYTVSIECFEAARAFARSPAATPTRSRCASQGAAAGRRHAAAQIRARSTPNTIERPSARSSVFTYHGPGSLLPGTGFKGRTGVADYTVYSKIRFPLADAPAFANSQSFMNWGNCEATGRHGLGMRGKVAAYRCRAQQPDADLRRVGGGELLLSMAR